MKSRAPLLLGLLAGFAVLAGLFQLYGYRDAWTLWKIPAVMPPFADARVITSGADAYRQGIDPMVANETDPLHRRLNYPRVWQGLYPLGLSSQHANAFGVVLAVLFLLGIALFAPPLDWLGAGLMVAAVFSPSTLLALERGNTDLAIFFILAAAIVLAPRHPVWSVATIAVAFVLKLYPICGLAVVFRYSRPVALKALLGFALLAGLYVVLTWDDLVRVQRLTYYSTAMSYGMNVTWMKGRSVDPTLGLVLRGLSYATVVAVIAWSAWTLKKTRTGQEPSSRTLDAFRVGAACFTGSFLLGNNFDYRMIFLIFTIPQLVEWVRDGARLHSGAAKVALLTMFLSMWSLFIERQLGGATERGWLGFLIAQSAQWILFGTLGVLLARTVRMDPALDTRKIDTD